MTKYRCRWPAVLAIALAIWFIIGLVAWKAFAGGLENAAALALDRNLCGMQVDQKKIELQLIIGAKERNISIEDAINVAASASISAKEFMMTQPMNEVLAYCAKRSGY